MATERATGAPVRSGRGLSRDAGFWLVDNATIFIIAVAAVCAAALAGLNWYRTGFRG